MEVRGVNFGDGIGDGFGDDFVDNGGDGDKASKVV